MANTPTPDQDASAGTKLSKLRPGLRVVLILSLALNLLIVGIIAGGMLNGRRPAPFGGYDPSLGAFARALAPEDRRAVGDELRRRLPMEDRGAARALAVRELLSALTAEPFDPAKIETLFARQRDLAGQAMTAGQDVLLERIKAMSAQGRADFADRLREQISRDGKGSDG